MAVITISRRFGTDARSFAFKLSKKLGYPLVDKKIYKEVGEKAKISPENIKSFESLPGLGVNFIQNLIKQNFIKRIVNKNELSFDDNDIVKFIEDTIKEYANVGNVIIMGRASQCVLQKHPSAYHIKLVRDFEDRVSYMMKRGVTRDGAISTMERKDKERKHFIEKYYSQDWENPELYHLYINLSKISEDKGIKLIEELISS